MKHSLLLSACLCLLVGCSTPYKSPVFKAKQGAAPTFDGVADLLDKTGSLDVLLVHGMCTHDADWAKGAVQDLVEAMGGDPGRVRLKPVAVKETIGDIASDTGIMLHQQTFGLPSGSLRLNAIEWSPLTTPLKADLCYDQTIKSPQCPTAESTKVYPYRRAGFNRMMKDGLLNDCLSDALIYQGKARAGINARMQLAVLQAVNTTGGQAPGARVQGTVPMVIITDSLGSKITFDAIFKLASATDKDKEKAGKALFNRTAQVFMRANQMPLLALADRYLDGTVTPESNDAGFPADPIQALFMARQNEPGPKSAHALKVVAFSDPNDLLSFALVGSPHAARADYPIVDVIVSNDDTYMGAFERPDNAHSDYKKNKEVRQLIACGTQRSLACKK